MYYILFIIKSALFDFSRNKGRTFLTSLGILIGVMSVVLLMAFGLGLKKYIEQQFESLGKNLIMVLPGQGFSRNGGQGLIGGIQFDEKDVLKLKRLKSIEKIAPVFSKTLKIEAKNKSEISMLLGSTSDIFKVINLEIGEGRFFNNADFEKGAKVVVLGSEIANKLFKFETGVLGRTVRIQNQRFVVIGILKKKGGGAMGSDVDTHSIVPYKSAISLNPNKKFFAIYAKAKNNENMTDVKALIKKTLLKRYKEDDFSVTEQAELLSTINSIFSILNSVLIAIASISLIVGGIGIMNIMYVSVTERIKEIGIRRAIGAKRIDILTQFITMSVLLSLFGGAVGLLLSFIIVFFIQQIFPAYIDIWSILLSLGVSSLIGIIFGVLPAKKAADLSPIDAIRYE